MTTDIFNNKILCGKCDIRMQPTRVSKNGFELRAISCPKCRLVTIHPKDEQEYNDFINLKKKNFSVKMRFVGNSYAVSIPKEIVDFMKDQEKVMDDMVNLCFEEFGRISLNFNSLNNKPNSINIKNANNINMEEADKLKINKNER